MQASSDVVSQFMHQPVIAVGPGASVDEVMSLSEASHVHHIPIVQGGRLLGIVCTCDIRGARPDMRALQLARRNVVTVTPDCSILDAARRMVTEGVGSLVVANGEGICGIVTRKDLAAANAAVAEMLASERCAACDATEHLRPGPGETLLCVTCADLSELEPLVRRRQRRLTSSSRKPALGLSELPAGVRDASFA